MHGRLGSVLFAAAMAAVEHGATVRAQGMHGDRVVLDGVSPSDYGRLLDAGWLPTLEPTTWAVMRSAIGGGR